MKTNEIKINDDTMLSWYCDCSLFHHSQPFELKMRYEDCKLCCHSGSCDDDCESMIKVDYIHKQLENISNAQILGFVSEYICDEDISDKLTDRNWLELYLIWLVSGNILDEICMGEIDGLLAL